MDRYISCCNLYLSINLSFIVIFSDILWMQVSLTKYQVCSSCLVSFSWQCRLWAVCCWTNQHRTRWVGLYLSYYKYKTKRQIDFVSSYNAPLQFLFQIKRVWFYFFLLQKMSWKKLWIVLPYILFQASLINLFYIVFHWIVFLLSECLSCVRMWTCENSRLNYLSKG